MRENKSKGKSVKASSNKTATKPLSTPANAEQQPAQDKQPLDPIADFTELIIATLTHELTPEPLADAIKTILFDDLSCTVGASWLDLPDVLRVYLPYMIRAVSPQYAEAIMRSIHTMTDALVSSTASEEISCQVIKARRGARNNEQPKKDAAILHRQSDAGLAGMLSAVLHHPETARRTVRRHHPGIGRPSERSGRKQNHGIRDWHPERAGDL